MSDTSGASDLDNDMPGIGAATGNVRGPPVQLPSQLQALVQHFSQTSQGRPNPKFLPPAPGQGGQQGKKPQLGSTDGPPDQSARSFATLPANAPQPPPSFTPYMPPVPRDHSQWGKPEPFERLPQSFEVNGLQQQLGNYFAQHGAYATAPLGAGLAGQSKEFQDAYIKGMDFKMRMANEQRKLHAEQLEDLETARSLKYSDIFTRHAAEGTDPYNDLWGAAVEAGDNDVAKMMENGDSIEKIRRYLAAHEANIRALSASNKKSDEVDAEDAKRWGLPDSPSADTDRYPLPAASTPDARGKVAGPGAPSEEGASPAPHEPAKLKPYEQVGLDIARGRPPTGLPKKVEDAAQSYAADVDQRMDDVVAHSEGKTRDQIARELKGISPTIAADWSKLVDGHTGLPGGMGAIGARPYWSNLSDLAIAVKPGWTAKDFEQLGQLNRDYTDGPTGRRMQRLESMAAAGRTLLEAYQQIPEGETPPEGLLEKWIATGVTGESKWGRVFSAYHTYVQEAQTIASQSGNFHEADVQRVMREAPYTTGPEFVRGSTLLVDAQNAVDTMSAYNDDYVKMAGKDAPHYNANAINTLKTIASYDPVTHRFTQVLDPRLQGLDRSFDAQPKGPTGQPAPGGLPPGWTVSPVQ